MSQDYIIRATQWVVCPENKRAIYGERAYTVEIDDEGAGEFVTLRDVGAPHPDRFTLEPAAWPAVKQAIEGALYEIREHEGKRRG